MPIFTEKFSKNPEKLIFLRNIRNFKYFFIFRLNIALVTYLHLRYNLGMKIKLWVILAVLTAVALLGCNGSSGSSKGEINFNKDASYALGLNIGSGLKEGLEADGIYPNIDEFIKGMRDGITGREPRIDVFQARELIEATLDAIFEERSSEARQEEIMFLAENARNPGINITSSGLQYEVVVERTGPKPAEFDTVLIHYEGKFTDGKFFDSSYTRGYPQEMELDWIIPGWSEGIQLMSVGSTYRFYVPSELAYGDEGLYDIIPPFATLIFDVELLEIK